MIPVKLLIITDDAQEESIVLDFLRAPELPADKAKAIRTGIAEALYGTDIPRPGKIVFEFKRDDVQYTVERNTENNEAAYFAEKEPVERAQLQLPDFDRDRWELFSEVDETAMYVELTDNAESYLAELWQRLGMDDSSIAARKADEERTNRELTERIDMLGSLLCEKTKEELEDEITILSQKKDDLTEEDAVLIEAALRAQIASEAYGKMQRAKKASEAADAERSALDADKAKADRSEKIKRQNLFLEQCKPILIENDGLQKEIDETVRLLHDKEKEISGGEKTLALAKDEYLEEADLLRRKNAALDSLICDNIETGKADRLIFDEVHKVMAETEEKIDALKERETVLRAQADALDADIATVYKNMNGVRLTADVRQAVREGAKYETALREKEYGLDAVTKLSVCDARQMELLKEEIEKNQKLYEEADRRMTAVAHGEENCERFVSLYNLLEQKKQKLYRNQIMSAGLLAEVNAIEAKMSENLSVKKIYEDKIVDVEEAAKTVEQNLQKLNKKKDRKEKELAALRLEKERYAEADGLEYGEKCPVCAGIVTRKTDNTAAENAVTEKINRLLEEIDVVTENAEECRKQHCALEVKKSELAAKSDVIDSYVIGLNEAKRTKISAANKLWEECSVTSHAELSALLEETVREISDMSVMISDIKGESTSKKIAAETVRDLTAVYTALAESLETVGAKVIDDTQSGIERCRADYAAFSATLEGKEAVGMLDDILTVEKKEDELYAELMNKIEVRNRVQNELQSVTKELGELTSRDTPLTDGGRSYSYGQLCVALTSRQYYTVTEDIRAQEEECLNVQKRIAVLTELIAEKKKEATALKGKIDALTEKFNMNAAWAVHMQEVIQPDESVYGAQSTEDMIEEIISDEETAAIYARVAEADQKAVRCRANYEESESIYNMNDMSWEAVDQVREAQTETEQKLVDVEEKLIRAYTDYMQLRSVGEKIRQIDLLRVASNQLLQGYENALNNKASALAVKATANLQKFYSEYSFVVQENGAVAVRYENTSEGETFGRIVENSLEGSLYEIVCLCLAESMREITEEAWGKTGLMRTVAVRSDVLSDQEKEKIRKVFGQTGTVVIFVKK